MTEQKKKTKLQDFIDTWNGAIIDNQISENDIKNPNEVSFRHNLILCLSNLHVNITSFANIDNESGSRLKASRCRLVAWINEILKTASGSAAFRICYMDLLFPKRHCVMHCLQYLINYIVFVHSMDDAIEQSHKSIKELSDLKTQKNDLKRMIESSKLSRDPQTSIATFKERGARLNKQLQEIQQEKNKCDLNIVELKTQISAISANIVTEQEAKSILQAREDVKEQFQEQEEIISFERNRLQEMSQNIEKTTSAVYKMEQIISHCAIDLSDFKEHKKQQTKLKAGIVDMRQETDNNINEIQAFSQVIEKKKTNIAKLETKKTEAEKIYHEVIKKDQIELKQCEAILKKVEEKENEIFNEQMVIKEEMELMYKVSSNIIKQMSESIFE